MDNIYPTIETTTARLDATDSLIEVCVCVCVCVCWGEGRMVSLFLFLWRCV